MGNEHEPFDEMDDLVLRLWSDDESAKAELVMKYVPALERTINARFQRLHSDEVEDVIAEAIRRFWKARQKFDPSRFPLGACLYRTAVQVASEVSAGRLNWQKSRQLEKQEYIDEIHAETFGVRPSESDTAMDQLEDKQAPLLKAFKDAFVRLDRMWQDILQAFADSENVEVDAGKLGIELGIKYKGGVPIPAGTIRQYKLRARRALIEEMKKRGFNLESQGF